MFLRDFVLSWKIAWSTSVTDLQLIVTFDGVHEMTSFTCLVMYNLQIFFLITKIGLHLITSGMFAHRVSKLADGKTRPISLVHVVYQLISRKSALICYPSPLPLRPWIKYLHSPPICTAGFRPCDVIWFALQTIH